mmetsp:Transcript_73689/g.159465  ORF Transcript_73689/g.159465 Transcript_73689/m.159465 type:complete len:82 (-) Transcript_73689:125-370(-)
MVASAAGAILVRTMPQLLVPQVFTAAGTVVLRSSKDLASALAVDEALWPRLAVHCRVLSPSRGRRVTDILGRFFLGLTLHI